MGEQTSLQAPRLLSYDLHNLTKRVQHDKN
jgi:hypothetical protein